MGDTAKPYGEPRPAPDRAPRSHRRKKGHTGPARSSVERAARPALADLYHTHYRSLIRLAVLLTGDTGTAEAVVVDSFVALERTRKGLRSGEDALPHLRRLVVTRSRSTTRRGRPASSGQSPVMARMPGYPDRTLPTPPLETSAVILALAALPAAQREAVVLTLYLDLADEEAAAAMRVSQAAMRRHLAAAKTALHPVLAREDEPPGIPG